MNFVKNIFLSVLISIFLFWSSFALSWDDLFNTNNPEIPYCNEYDSQWNNECWIKKWTEKINGQIEDVISDRPLSQYIQDVITYLMGFVTLVAVIYVLYAWFNILTWWWDEEKVKKSKTIIIYVAAGILLIWIARPIVFFIIDVLSAEPTI